MPASLIEAAIDAAPQLRIPFADAMHIALYADRVGYYRSGKNPIGLKGDFITSVSAGPCLGTLLARHYASLWESAGSPDRFLAVEQGAHDGRLAADILHALAEFRSPLLDAIHLTIIEPDLHLRSLQTDLLSPLLGPRLTHISDPADLASLDLIKSHTGGIFFANELLDAFPVHLARFQNGSWHELYLARSTAPSPASPFALVPGPPSYPDVTHALAHLPQNLPDGYETEIHLAHLRWIKSVAASGFRGEICLIDYGFEREEYYAPHRTTGTIRRYSGHRTDGRILENLGAADLTAHVEWTSLIAAARSAGLSLTEFTDQHHFLIHLATPWLRELESSGATGDTEPRIRQLQTLIHPTSMGRSFQVLRLHSSPS